MDIGAQIGAAVNAPPLDDAALWQARAEALLEVARAASRVVEQGRRPYLIVGYRAGTELIDSLDLDALERALAVYRERAEKEGRDEQP